jgi:alpha-1,2-mannosyltransferase
MPSLSFPRLLDRFRTAHAAHPHRFRAAGLAALAVVVLVTSLQYAAKVSKPADDGRQSRSAFLRWRAMIRDVFAGANVYVGKNEYPNPPVMAIVLRPFAELPPVVGAMAWFYSKVLMAVLAALWTFRLVSSPLAPALRGEGPGVRGDSEDPSPGGEAPPPSPRSGERVKPRPLAPQSWGEGKDIPDAVKATAILVALPALVGDLTHNNVNIFILFLIAACLELYRRGRDAASGLVLALAVACKVTPLLFLGYFAWKRAWRIVAGCTVGLVLWLAVVPGAAFGWERNAQLLTDWYKLMVERPVLKGEITTEHPNQALPGFVYRLFTHSPSFIAYEKTPEGDIPVPAAYHNVADIGRPTAWVVVKALTAAFALAVVLLCRPGMTERQGWRFAAECGLIVLGMLLFSERTWKHHAVTLLIPAAALACAATLDLPRGVRRFAVGSLVASALLMTLPGLLGTRAQDLALVYGTHTAAFLLLTAAVCAVLGRAAAARERPLIPDRSDS